MDFYVQILKIPIGMICYDFWPVMCMFNLTENCRMLEHISCCMVFCMQCWFSPVKTESVRVMISKGSQRKKKNLNFSDLKNCGAGQKIKNNNKKPSILEVTLLYLAEILYTWFSHPQMVIKIWGLALCAGSICLGQILSVQLSCWATLSNIALCLSSKTYLEMSHSYFV